MPYLTVHESVPFSPLSSILIISCLFKIIAILTGRKDILLYCDFDLYLKSNPLVISGYWALFHIPVGYLYVVFGKCIFRSSVQVKSYCLILMLSYMSFYVLMLAFIRWMICKYSVPFSRLSFTLSMVSFGCEVLVWYSPNWFIFIFIAFDFAVKPKRFLLRQVSEVYSPAFSNRVLCFRS